MVDVQKLRAFDDCCGACATICGDSRGRGGKTGLFYDFCGAAEIRVVKVKQLRTFYDSYYRPRVTLCGDRARRSALAMAPCEFVLVSANPLRRSCATKRFRCGVVQFSCSRNGFWKLSRFARLVSHSRGRRFDSPLVPGSSSSSKAAVVYSW